MKTTIIQRRLACQLLAAFEQAEGPIAEIHRVLTEISEGPEDIYPEIKVHAGKWAEMLRNPFYDVRDIGVTIIRAIESDYQKSYETEGW